MAKAEEKISNVKEESFQLTDKVKNEGYKNPKLNIIIDFERDYDGKRKTRFASSGKTVNGEFISDKQDHLTGLDGEQVYILATAGVIKVKKSQRHYYIEHLKTINRINLDD